MRMSCVALIYGPPRLINEHTSLSPEFQSLNSKLTSSTADSQYLTCSVSAVNKYMLVGPNPNHNTVGAKKTKNRKSTAEQPRYVALLKPSTPSSRLHKVGIWIRDDLCWCSFFLLCRDQRTVIFPPSGFYSTHVLELKSHSVCTSEAWTHNQPSGSELPIPRGSRYLIIKELGLKDHYYNGFWDLIPLYLGIWTLWDRLEVSGSENHTLTGIWDQSP